MMNEFGKQIEEHIPALQRYARALARNAFAAEDLVQDCVLRALTKEHLFKPDTNLRAWLFTILHNLHISEIRRTKKWKPPANPEAAMAALSVKAPQPASVMLRAVEKAMMALPNHHRSVLYSVGVTGDSYEQASARFDLPVGTVKSRCFRARKGLQRALNDAYPEEGSLSLVV